MRIRAVICPGVGARDTCVSKKGVKVMAREAKNQIHRLLSFPAV